MSVSPVRLAFGICAIVLFWSNISASATPSWSISAYRASGDVLYVERSGDLDAPYDEVGVMLNRTLRGPLFVGIGLADYGEIEWQTRLSGPGGPPLFPPTKLSVRALSIHAGLLLDAPTESPVLRNLSIGLLAGFARFEVDDPPVGGTPSSGLLLELALYYALSESLSVGLLRRDTTFDSEGVGLAMRVKF